MQTVVIAILAGLCCLIFCGCWGAPKWYDDEAQGRHVREIKAGRDAEWDRRARRYKCHNRANWWFSQEL